MIGLFHGVLPTKKNRISKRSFCTETLEHAELKSVKTYIQSGNSVFSTEKEEVKIRKLIHDTIKLKKSRSPVCYNKNQQPRRGI